MSPPGHSKGESRGAQHEGASVIDTHESDASPVNVNPRAADDDPTPRPQVLLVDDNEVNLLLTSVALRERGFGVTEAGSGEQALQLLSRW